MENTYIRLNPVTQKLLKTSKLLYQLGGCNCGGEEKIECHKRKETDFLRMLLEKAEASKALLEKVCDNFSRNALSKTLDSREGLNIKHIRVGVFGVFINKSVSKSRRFTAKFLQTFCDN